MSGVECVGHGRLRARLLRHDEALGSTANVMGLGRVHPQPT